MKRTRLMRSANRYLLSGLLVLLLLNVVVFWPVLTFDFVSWDDDISITENSLLTDPWSGSLLTRLFAADHALRFKPLHWLLSRGIHATFGLNPAAWHAFNLIFHLAAAALFYVTLRQVLTLIPGYVECHDARAELAPLMGAAFWSLHPLRAEAVAWATASTYPLSAVCVLAAFVCYLRAHAGTSSRGWLLSAWLLTVLAYASYPVTVTFGLWLIAVDKWLLPFAAAASLPGAARTTIDWRKHACFLIPAALAVAMTLWSRFTTPGVFTVAPTVESVGLGTRMLMALASLSYLAGRIVWPFDLTPNMPPVTSSALDATIVALAAIAGGVLLVAWWLRRNRPLLALTCLGFAAVSLPCLGLTERPTWPVDRYSYIAHLPLIGSAAVGLIMIRATTRLRTALGVAAAIATGGAAFAARMQSTIWRDTGALFTHMRERPDFASNPRQQGHIYLMWAKHEAANARPASAVQFSEQAYQVYLDAIKRAVAASDYAEALALLTHVERYFGLTPVLHREKGAWLLRENRMAEANQSLQEAARSLPDDARVRSLQAEAESRAPGLPPSRVPP